MMRHCAIHVPVATGDERSADILFRYQITDLVEGLWDVMDCIDNARRDAQAALTVHDTIDFLEDLVRAN